MERDPVCGMAVDPNTASLTVSHQGKLYYFCGAHCQSTFSAEPARYAEATTS